MAVIFRKKKPNRRIGKTGTAPGTLIFTGKTVVETPDVTIVQYDDAHFEEQILRGLDCTPKIEGKVTWYDVRGLNDVALVEHVGHTFNVHPLALEDVLNTAQRAKWDDYDNGVFIIVRALRYEAEMDDIVPEQVSFYLEKHVLLSFQEDKHDLFSTVRDRLQKGQGKIRLRGTDYLAYALVDCIVDEYINILDHTEEEIEALEIQILTQFTPSVRSGIYKLKRQLTEIRRAVLPLRDVVGRFSREEGAFVEPINHVYIRDLYDHVVRVIESIENQRDMLNNLDDLFNSEQANRANHVMKVLTIVSAIFIPLTFIAGIYGTNFDVLPELHHPQGYFWMWGVMVLIAVLQLIYFKWKKWM